MGTHDESLSLHEPVLPLFFFRVPEPTGAVNVYAHRIAGKEAFMKYRPAFPDVFRAKAVRQYSRHPDRSSQCPSARHGG